MFLLSFTTSFNWYLQQFDVKNAFLHGDLEDEVYMEPSLGLNENFGDNKICRLKKAFYKFKQPPGAWFGRFIKVILAIGYKQNQGDHTFFIKHSFSRGVISLLIIATLEKCFECLSSE